MSLSLKIDKWKKTHTWENANRKAGWQEGMKKDEGRKRKLIGISIIWLRYNLRYTLKKKT